MTDTTPLETTFDRAPAKPHVANTSGDRSRAVPPQAKGGSWGAFMFGGVWALSNRVWFGALVFLTGLAPVIRDSFPLMSGLAMIVGSGVWVYLTVCGRSLAWTHKRWNSYEHFSTVQRTWSRVAKFIFFISLALLVVAGVVFWMALTKGLSHMNG